MKARTCYGLLITVLLLGSTACKKHRIERKYTGDFNFTVQSHYWSLSTGTSDTTYTYAGKIIMTDEVPNGLSEDNEYLKIFYLASGGYEITPVDKHGQFSVTASGGFTSDDELDFVIKYTGHSASLNNTVHGVRR